MDFKQKVTAVLASLDGIYSPIYGASVDTHWTPTEDQKPAWVDYFYRYDLTRTILGQTGYSIGTPRSPEAPYLGIGASERAIALDTEDILAEAVLKVSQPVERVIDAEPLRRWLNGVRAMKARK